MRLAVLLLAAGLVGLLAWETRRHPKEVRVTPWCTLTIPGTHPRFDPHQVHRMPCRILDEGLRSQWDI